MNFPRMAVFIAALFSAGVAALPVLVAPPAGCPGWHLSRWSTGTPWSFLAGWPLATLALPLFIAIRWDWCVRKQAEADSSPALMPSEYVLARLCLFGVTWSQIPSLIVLDCFIK